MAISQLRAELATWVEKARAGEEVVITERGTPVARLVGVESASLLEQLTAQGVIGAAGASSRPRARHAERVRGIEPVSPLVAEQRR